MSPVMEDAAGSAERLRAAMVERLRQEDAIVSDAVAAAFGAVPRHVFAPGEPLARAYETQTTLLPKTDAEGTETSVVSAPFVQAVMLEQAQIEPGMRVLELGSGGYNAALIAELVGPGGEVTTVDIDPVITGRASTFLANAGYDRVRVIQSDGEHGASQWGPFDRIVVTFGAWDIAPAWLDQLSETGRIVVPLRFAGLTRLIAFDRSARGLVSDSYRLGAFVPVQGEGAFDEELVAITSEVGLRLDRVHSQTFDGPALRKAVHSPSIERWSGAVFDMPDELALYLATSAPVVPILHVSQSMVDQGIFALSARRGIPALVEDGSFAYRTKRENETLGGFESGVVAHGPDAEALAGRYVDLLQQWAANYRYRNAARIEYFPNGSTPGALSGWHVAKRHGVVAVTWP